MSVKVQAQNLLVFPVLLALCLSPCSAAVETCDHFEEARFSLKFGDSLFLEGDYYRAVGEYKKLIFLCPSWPGRPGIELRIGRAYAAALRWDDALNTLGQLVARYPRSSEAQLAALDIGRAHIERNEFGLAASRMRAFLEDHPSSDKLHRQATMLLAESLVHDQLFEAARLVLAGLDDGIPSTQWVGRIQSELSQHRQLPSRSPWLAGVLSAVVPGTGQFYAGRARDGILALFLNGLFAAGAYEAVEHHVNVAAGATAFFGFAWYTGNVFSAVNSAERFNRDSKARFIAEITAELRAARGEEAHAKWELP
jgi:outer membrane protein assembly factor BamD (BamD/ComL family)/TM2 domain-containing membrane protein YozV